VQAVQAGSGLAVATRGEQGALLFDGKDSAGGAGDGNTGDITVVVMVYHCVSAPFTSAR
jgi:hypothetical protein